MHAYARLFLLLTALLAGISLRAQHTFTAKVLDHEHEEALAGVTIHFPGLGLGAVTDAEGLGTVSGIPDGEHAIEIRFVGYETIAIKRRFPLERPGPEVFEMHHDHEEMEAVFITATRSSRTIEDIPTRVEFIAGEELAEKGNMKPGDIRMLLNESTGIQTQQTSATSYNSSIRIQGLDGKYTQLLRDGLPLYSGFSGGLSLMQVAPLDLKQVEVIKGASSTLYGGGAIAGLVNLVTKTPGEAPELSFLLNGTSALGLDASGFYSGRSGKIGGTVFASYNHGSPYDPAGIGLTAIPEFDRFTLNPRLFFYPKPGTELQLGANVVAENRTGGSMAYAKGETEAGYFERNETARISTQFQLRHRLSERAQVALKNSFSFYDRGISLPGYRFAGTQRSSFSEASVTVSGERMEWIAGLNLWTDAFAQQDGEGGQDLGFSNATVGGFVQHLWNLHERWALETGFRLDRQSEYGLFALPRVSLLYEASEHLTFRLGGGMGYKTPTAFSEEAERLHFRGIAPIAAGLEAERSVGGNFDINHRMDLGEELSVSTNVLLFYTQIDRPLVLAREGGAWAFGQPDGQIATKGLELNMKWSFHDLKLFVGYTHARVEQEAGGAAADFPLVARHRLNNVLMYEKHENFRIGLEAYYFSPQRLGDGTEGQAYWIAGLMGEKSFGERLSVFLNFENLLDARQTRFDTIFTGSLDSPQFRDIYAPVDGFVVNGGIKLRLL